MSTTLPLFWKLSSASKKDRVDASVKLISALEQFQVLHVPQSKSDGSDNEGGDGLDALNSQDVSYSIRRLVRGLASPRESSRLGFSVALTEVRPCPSTDLAHATHPSSLAALPDRHHHLCAGARAHRRLYETAGFHERTGREGRLVCTLVWDRCGRAIRIARAPNTVAKHLVERARIELGNIRICLDIPIGNRGGKVLVEGECLVDDRVGCRCGPCFLGAVEGRGARLDDQGCLFEG